MKLIDRQPNDYYNTLIKSMESELGVSLLPGDERRIFADVLSYILMTEDVVYNNAFAQFSPETATGLFLDVLGTRVGVSRTSGQTAYIQLTCQKLDSSDSVVLAEGTKYTIDGLNFKQVGNVISTPGSEYLLVFIESETKEAVNNNIGNSSVVICDNTSEWAKISGFFVVYQRFAIEDDTENDELYRQRVISGYTQNTIVNTENGWLTEIQKYNSNIIDAEFVANQGEITVYPLLLDNNGYNVIPDATLCSNIQNYLNASPKRPLGDTVIVSQPTKRQVNFVMRLYVPYADLGLAQSKSAAYQTEICRKLSGNIKADYSEAVVIDTVLDIFKEAKDCIFTSDITPGINNSLPKRSAHVTGEIFVYDPNYIAFVFSGI